MFETSCGKTDTQNNGGRGDRTPATAVGVGKYSFPVSRRTLNSVYSLMLDCSELPAVDTPLHTQTIQTHRLTATVQVKLSLSIDSSSVSHSLFTVQTCPFSQHRPKLSRPILAPFLPWASVLSHLTSCTSIIVQRFTESLRVGTHHVSTGRVHGPYKHGCHFGHSCPRVVVTDAGLHYL